MSDKCPLNSPEVVHPRYNSINDDRRGSMITPNFTSKFETTEV